MKNTGNEKGTIYWDRSDRQMRCMHAVCKNDEKSLKWTKYKLTILNFLFIHSYNSNNHVIDVTEIFKLLKFLYQRANVRYIRLIKMQFLYLKNIRDNTIENTVYLGPATFTIRNTFTKNLKIFATNFPISCIVQACFGRTYLVGLRLKGS